MPTPEKSARFVVLITGETPGTGSSSNAKLVAEYFGLPRISAGGFFRALAWEFQAFVEQQQATNTLSQVYAEFMELYQTTFNREGVEGIKNLLTASIGKPNTEEVLTTFHRAIAEHTAQTGQQTTLWDQFVDMLAIDATFSEPAGAVLEGKVSIFALELDQMIRAFGSDPRFSIPIFRILLKVTPEEAARRISERESTVTAQQVVERAAYDFFRYTTIYTRDTVPITSAILSETADYSIDTDGRPLDVVADDICMFILGVLETVGAAEAAPTSYTQEE